VNKISLTARLSSMLSCLQAVLLVLLAGYVLIARIKYGEVTGTPGLPGYQIPGTWFAASLLALFVGVIGLALMVWVVIYQFRSQSHYRKVYWYWLLSVLLWALWLWAYLSINNGGGV
jgi:divalent metal cation (Fe/Co/Zn/Cd) transporter